MVTESDSDAGAKSGAKSDAATADAEKLRTMEADTDDLGAAFADERWASPPPRTGRPNLDPTEEDAEQPALESTEISRDERIERLYRYLTEPAPGERIQGLDVSRERLRLFITFLTDRANAVDGALALRAARIRHFLTEDLGTPMEEGVNLARLRMLLNGARRRLGLEVQRKTLLDLPVAGAELNATLSLEQIQQTMRELLGVVQSLQQRFEQAEIRAGTEQAPVSLAKDSPSEQQRSSARESTPWYQDFIN